MISKGILDAINEQIRNELGSAHIYLSMAAWCQAENLPGFAHWMQLQHDEETGHAMRLFRYVYDRGGRVKLQGIAQPPVDFRSVLDVVQQTLDHEKRVTASIYKLYELAVKEKDYATQTHLQWFITEQVEEEKQALQIVEHLKRIGSQGPALYLLDKEVGSRTKTE